MCTSTAASTSAHVRSAGAEATLMLASSHHASSRQARATCRCDRCLCCQGTAAHAICGMHLRRVGVAVTFDPASGSATIVQAACNGAGALVVVARAQDCRAQVQTERALAGGSVSSRAADDVNAPAMMAACNGDDLSAAHGALGLLWGTAARLCQSAQCASHQGGRITSALCGKLPNFLVSSNDDCDGRRRVTLVRHALALRDLLEQALAAAATPASALPIRLLPRHGGR